MRRRRTAIVLAASTAAHVALFAAWMSMRSDPHLAESPTLQVELVRLPPKASPPPPAPREAPQPPPRNRPPIEIHQTPPPVAPTAMTPAPLEISPEWRVKPGGSGGADLDAAPFVLGRTGLKRARTPRASCKTHGWDRPLDCPPDEAEIAASKADPARDSRTGGFAGEGARKTTMKSYRESPSTSDYPGIRCSIFHKC